jgi:cyclohexadieny/prephenate dehydrogenase
MFQQITILGPGLLGASLAMAIKKHTPATRISVWTRKPESREKCRKQEWCDVASGSPEEAVADSDLTLFCTPVHTILPLLEQIQPALKKGSLISDVGSTKALICNGAQRILKDTSTLFLGSHPMAGSEQTGMENARPDLFKGAACIVTPLPDTPKLVTQKLSQFWESLEMHVTTVPPETHDSIVAHISHLPHILASVLCSYLSQKDNFWQTLGGGGLRDTTRIASGDPELWKQILEQNRDEILQAISGFEQKLGTLKTALTEADSEEILSQLKQGKVYRDQLIERRTLNVEH